MKNLFRFLVFFGLFFAGPLGLTAQPGECSCDPIRDSLMLVELKDSLQISNWDSSKPLYTWNGVYIGVSGCVDSLILFDRMLSGAVPSSLFDRLPCLKTLDLGSSREYFFNNSQRNILTISIPSSVARLTQLQRLNLGGNTLSAVAPELFSLPSLKALQLYYTGLTGIPSSYNLPGLERLDLLGNPLLKTVPGELRVSTKLNWLSLSNCGLTKVPEGILNFENLQFLGLSSNQISILPAELGTFSRLRILNLSGNQLSSIPSWIGNLDSLTSLSLTNNFFLTQLPPEIGNLKSLEYLDLSTTRISSLPIEIGRLTNLQTLKAVGLDLKGLPESIGKLTNLQRLELLGNKIKILPSGIGTLTKLNFLDLRNNLLGKLPASLAELSNLETLLLSNNELDTFSIDVTKFKRLKQLELTKNKLNFFPEQLTTLDSLELLYLNFNQIKGEIPGAINNLKRLRQLWLNNNEITQMPALTLSLSQMGLDSNRLTFDDILPNRHLLLTDAFVQKPFFPEDISLVFSPCDTPVIHLGIDESVEGNEYQWVKDKFRRIGVYYENSIDLSLLDPDFLPYSEYGGDYVCQVTNLEIPGMVIRSIPIKVNKTIPCLARFPKMVKDTLCINEEIMVDSTPYNRQNPSGCEVIKGRFSACDTLVLIDLSFRNTDTTIIDTLRWGERRRIGERWYDCSNPVDTLYLKSRLSHCDSIIYIHLYCNSPGQANSGPKDALLIPGAFTPNGDGFNETFDIPAIIQEPLRYGKNRLQIFNRFRQAVFEQANYRNEWDGIDSSGRPLPAGTYYYLFVVDGRETFSGTVTILR